MSAHWDYPRNICSVRVLTEVAAGHGMTVADCLRGTRVDAASLHDHTAMVAACDELQVIRNLQARLGTQSPLALEAGLRYHPTTFGVWGFMILSSVTLQQAVDVGMRYLRLTSFYCRIRLTQTDDELLVVADDSELPADVRDFLLERDGATLMNLAKDILPLRFSLTRVETRRARPSYHKQADALFGRAVSYDQGRNCVGLQKAMLGWKLPQADLPMRRMFEAECERLLQRHQTLAGIAGRVRERLLRDPERMPTMETVATEFKETARTLRRRLEAAGTRFENLVEETRRTLAEELLRGTNLAISDVAERLGYSEPSTFIRAFKRWKSVSPQRYRKSSGSTEAAEELSAPP